jgi:ribonuclease HII
MTPDLWIYENQARQGGAVRIAGLDEAGRGPLAGPVVAAAVVVPPSFLVEGVNDSKKLTEKKRSLLFDRIYSHADGVGVGIADPKEIDRLNILRASLLAMARAVADLPTDPDHLLIDGTFRIPEDQARTHQIPADVPQTAIPKGDAKSISIAAASIIAKVTRDRLMVQYHREYPAYGFDRHKGYPTRAHREAIERHGVCAIHRRSFKGVKEHL